MSLRNTVFAYGAVSKFFHWLIFFLVLFMLVFGFLLDDIPKDYQGAAYNLHKLIGLSILLLMVMRLIWTLINPKPELSDVKPWERFVERLVHQLLYLAIIVMPLAGWIGASSSGRGPHLGSLYLGLPIPKDKALITTCFQLHGIFAFVIIGLVTLHVLAALYHHFIRKDDVLLRMMPKVSDR